MTWWERLAHALGLHRYEVYPVRRVRDGGLVGIYSRDLGWLWRPREPRSSIATTEERP